MSTNEKKKRESSILHSSMFEGERFFFNGLEEIQ